ncbi:universal stress protein [Aliiruegeria sabulilitoris]|uniref:universal stress protein n=1 Tax=Aliiruegeria sabulilitoris TaxID=1510458 RepID=UPI000834CA1B|nr:universal stress protein [Aliiruegeria sabulilitoris]NDR55312.1 universal stress protein [Pseudoruegeria sp. M32A2M]
MLTKIVVGLDGSGSGSRAVDYARKLGSLIGECELILVYVVEWSPFTFQTPEENAERHKRREEEIKMAMDRVVTPAVNAAKEAGHTVRGIVRHGDVADLLDDIAVKEGASQIVVARTSESGITQRIFGSSTANLVMHASVPVTVVG